MCGEEEEAGDSAEQGGGGPTSGDAGAGLVRADCRGQCAARPVPTTRKQPPRHQGKRPLCDPRRVSRHCQNHLRPTSARRSGRRRASAPRFPAWPDSHRRRPAREEARPLLSSSRRSGSRAQPASVPHDAVRHYTTSLGRAAGRASPAVKAPRTWSHGRPQSRGRARAGPLPPQRAGPARLRHGQRPTAAARRDSKKATAAAAAALVHVLAVAVHVVSCRRGAAGMSGKPTRRQPPRTKRHPPLHAVSCPRRTLRSPASGLDLLLQRITPCKLTKPAASVPVVAGPVDGASGGARLGPHGRLGCAAGEQAHAVRAAHDRRVEGGGKGGRAYCGRCRRRRARTSGSRRRTRFRPARTCSNSGTTPTAPPHQAALQPRMAFAAPHSARQGGDNVWQRAGTTRGKGGGRRLVPSTAADGEVAALVTDQGRKRRARLFGALADELAHLQHHRRPAIGVHPSPIAVSRQRLTWAGRVGRVGRQPVRRVSRSGQSARWRAAALGLFDGTLRGARTRQPPNLATATFECRAGEYAAPMGHRRQNAARLGNPEPEGSIKIGK